MPARRRPPAAPPPALLEWIMGGAGLLIVLGALGVLLLQAATPDQPARLEARLDRVHAASGAWQAEVEVLNHGDETAAAVEIEGRLGEETARASLDYVPARGRERAVLVFRDDPRPGLEVRVVGWTAP